LDCCVTKAWPSPRSRPGSIRPGSGRSTFPQIFIGETHIGGCDELVALDEAGEFDALLEA
jgi:glutaredoxin 3